MKINFEIKKGGYIMKMKKVIALLLVASMTIAMVGCSRSKNEPSSGKPANESSSSNKTKITFWHSMSEKNGEAIQSMVDSFNASQNEIEVVAEFQGTYDDTKTKLSAAMQSGGFPDICQMYDIGTKYMTNSGYTIPVEDFFASTGYDKSTVMDIMTSYYTVDGKQQSMPLNVSTPVLYYNKDAFKKAGIESVPTTFDEVLEAARKIVDSGASKYGYSQAVYGWFFEQEIATLGQYYADNENGRVADATKVNWAENGSAKKIMDTWMKLLDSGVCGNYGTVTADTQTAFYAGQSGMILESSAILGNAMVQSEFEIGTAYFPKVESAKDGGVIIGGASIWMMDTKDKARQEAAWKFVEYTTRADVQATWAQNTGYIATNAEAYKLDEMKAYIEKYPQCMTAVNQLAENPVNGYTSGVLSGVASESRKLFQEYMERVINGELSVDDAIVACEKDVNAAIANYNASIK